MWALRLRRVDSGQRNVGFLVAVGGVPRAELEACRIHGTACVVARLKDAGVFPCSVRGRAPVAAIASLPPSPLARGDLSERGLEALRAVVDAQATRVEELHLHFEPSEV